MRGIVIAVLGREEVARELGKKGTATDITFFNHRRGDVVHTILHPTRYPQSVQPLGNILGISQELVFDIQEMSASLGEQIIAAKHSGHKRAKILLGDAVGADEILPVFKDAGIEPILLEDVKQLRQELEDTPPPTIEGTEGITVVDQCFNVKGVGTVVLGFVASGTVRKHDDIVTTPGGARATIRSIQVQDEDQNEVHPFTRVGLALRGIDEKDIGKGSILAQSERKCMTEARATISKTRYWKGTLSEGMVLHLSNMFQFSPARVVSVDGDMVQLDMERPFLSLNDRALVFHLDSPRQRVVGEAVFI